MKSRISLILALFGSAQVVFSQWKCDYQVYGRPQLDDCEGALLSMPDALSKGRTTKLAAFRKFVEPQYLEPPFSQCHNELDAPMEQLPKFWRYIINAEPVSTWSFVERNAQKVSTNCLARKVGGGVIFIADPKGDGAMALYLYAVGAPFEAILNNYMITSQAIYPPGVASASNGTLTGVTTNGTLELAWALENT
ncbi:MAG: hypothetical protein ASARMPREDX12_000170 [Alectoria sarmentosa]|nr:MAG: hypothetical protein ASARMPREDX12_000170 [Alectoria sarmentosa]